VLRAYVATPSGVRPIQERGRSEFQPAKLPTSRAKYDGVFALLDIPVDVLRSI